MHYWKELFLLSQKQFPSMRVYFIELISNNHVTALYYYLMVFILSIYSKK